MAPRAAGSPCSPLHRRAAPVVTARTPTGRRLRVSAPCLGPTPRACRIIAHAQRDRRVGHGGPHSPGPHPSLGTLAAARIISHGLGRARPQRLGRWGVGWRGVRRLRTPAIGPQRVQQQRELRLIQRRHHRGEVDQTLLPIL